MGIALLASVLIFGVWYPWPMDKLTTGRELFGILIVVDIVCGPTLTMVVWSRYKTRLHIFLDVGFILMMQLAALVYGLYMTSLTRPVAVIFEADRLRVVVASEIDIDELINAPVGLREFSWTGPVLLSVRSARDSDEFLRSIDMSLAGKEPSIRPGWWQPYESGLDELLRRARPLDDIYKNKPDQSAVLRKAVEKSGVVAEDLVWLPLTSAKSMEWIVLLDKKSGMPRSYAAIDGFF